MQAASAVKGRVLPARNCEYRRPLQSLSLSLSRSAAISFSRSREITLILYRAVRLWTSNVSGEFRCPARSVCRSVWMPDREMVAEKRALYFSTSMDFPLSHLLGWNDSRRGVKRRQVTENCTARRFSAGTTSTRCSLFSKTNQEHAWGKRRRRAEEKKKEKFLSRKCKKVVKTWSNKLSEKKKTFSTQFAFYDSLHNNEKFVKDGFWKNLDNLQRVALLGIFTDPFPIPPIPLFHAITLIQPILAKLPTQSVAQSYLFLMQQYLPIPSVCLSARNL